jgi:hypothetical protein
MTLISKTNYIEGKDSRRADDIMSVPSGICVAGVSLGREGAAARLTDLACIKRAYKMNYLSCILCSSMAIPVPGEIHMAQRAHF